MLFLGAFLTFSNIFSPPSSISPTL
jgi:hypothetical protein